MKIANNWKDYKILDMAEGQKLEKWGEIILSRPDPQIIWKEKTYPKKWKEINAVYHRSKTGGGAWEFHKKQMQKVRDIAEKQPINQIPNPAGKNKRDRKQKHRMPLFRLPCKNQNDAQHNDRHTNQQPARILQNPERRATVLHIDKVHHMRDKVHRGSICKGAFRPVFRKLVRCDQQYAQ